MLLWRKYNSALTDCLVPNESNLSSHPIRQIAVDLALMLGKFFNKGGNAAAPAGKRIYAIGDVHGCLNELDALLERILEDIEGANLMKSAFNNDHQNPAPSKPMLIFLGDYVDRGPDSKGVLDQLIRLKSGRPETVFLKGNHEALLLDFLSDPEMMQHWLEWGGEETLESYGVKNVLGRSGEDLAAELSEKMPAAHLSFLQSLALTHIEGDYFFVHAGVRPGVNLDDQQEEDLLWIRKKFHSAAASERPDKVIVHGHQPMKKPLDAGWRIAVDTGACWTGKLTAVALEDRSRRFIST
jgi:diadenosine tetraphosphatase ApaH/serine/threonine PP2A family protein phosphatase